MTRYLPTAVFLLLIAAPAFASPALALDGDGDAPGDAQAERIRKALCASDGIADKCGTCSKSKRSPEIHRIFTGQFRPDASTEILAHIQQCENGRPGFALLEQGDRGLWAVDWQAAPPGPTACKHFRPGLPEGARDVLVCQSEFQLGASGRTRATFIAIRADESGLKARGLDYYSDDRAECPEDAFTAFRNVQWQSRTPSDPKEAPRLAISAETAGGTVPKDADDFCHARKNQALDPWSGAHRRTVVFELEARSRSPDWPFRTRFSKRHTTIDAPSAAKPSLERALARQPAPPLRPGGRHPDDETAERIAESVCADDAAKSLCDECPKGRSSLRVERVYEGQFRGQGSGDLVAVVRGCSTAAPTLVHLESVGDSQDGDSPNTGYRVGPTRRIPSLQTCSQLRPTKPQGARDVLVCHLRSRSEDATVGQLKALRVGDDGFSARELVEFHNNLPDCPVRDIAAVRPEGWRSWDSAGTDDRPRVAVLFETLRTLELPEGSRHVCDARKYRAFSPWEQAKKRTVIFELTPVERKESDALTRLEEAEPAVEDTRAAGVKYIESIAPSRGGAGFGQIGRVGTDRQSESAPARRRARVELAQPEVDGALEADIVRKVIRQHRRELKFCYETKLDEKPRPDAEMTVELTISPKGDVAEASISASSLDAAKFQECLRSKSQRWVFPAPRDDQPVTVQQSATFSTEQ